MDTSKEYVKMCEKAVEIQEYCRDNINKLRPSYIYDNLLNVVCLIIWCPKSLRKKLGQISNEHIVSIEENNDKGVYLEEGTTGTFYWLPRQGQLQDIYYTDKIKERFGTSKEVHIILSINIFLRENSVYVNLLNSMEQIWLAFIMKEKFNKVWDKDNWK